MSGTSPVFYRHPSEPAVDYPESLLSPPRFDTCSTDTAELMQVLDDNIATAWKVARRFCLTVNLGADTQRFVHANIIHDTMTAVMYRLLHMSFAANSIDEAARQGLLAFCYHIFLQWQDVKLMHYDFPRIFKAAIERLSSDNKSLPRLLLWLLMVGAVSVFDIAADKWLRDALRERSERCGIRTWKEMQALLKSFMWIALLDDQTGKKIFESLELGKRSLKGWSAA